MGDVKQLESHTETEAQKEYGYGYRLAPPDRFSLISVISIALT
jgi:hypothetical protein